jgi:hypothetical protein
MSARVLTTPVALFVYNRPDKTEGVLDQISTVEPERLLVVADGPRSESDGDQDGCEATRPLVEDGVDWDCELAWNAADTNFELKRRFATGLRWILEEASEAIMLEDDCLPNESFFRFCATMLEEFRDDERAIDVCGSNQLGEWNPTNRTTTSR